MSEFRVAEFYCGIGGFHCAVRRALPEAFVVAAFDIDKDGNRVYEHNTGLTPTQIDIGTLSVSFLEGMRASLWLLSPPCQPFTRQGLKRDVEDPRTVSFLKLLQKLTEMDLDRVPEFVLVENVVGFEKSETRERMLKAFKRSQLTAVQEFILSPHQLGIPYSRPRYFCLGRKQPFSILANEILLRPPHTFLNTQSPPEASGLVEFLEESVNEDNSFDVPEKFLSQCADVINVVSKESTRLNCFTKSYGGRYFKGTGSFLVTNRPEWIPLVCALQSICCQESAVDLPENGFHHLSQLIPNSVAGMEGLFHELPRMDFDARRLRCRPILLQLLKEMSVRYFTPREVASLHSFPPGFSFPDGIRRKRQYALLGNSLNVAVVANLIQYLATDVGSDSDRTQNLGMM